jgi:hypothetical protein
MPAVLFIQLHPLGKMINLPKDAELDGKSYRGTEDGTIFVSYDRGKTWQSHIQFGSEYSIQELFVNRSKQVRAQVKFAEHSFELALSKNGSHWLTI